MAEKILDHPTRNSGHSGSGGPPHMEARIARLESDMEHVKNDTSDIKSDLRDMRKAATADFRILFGALITTTLGLAWLIAKGFGWV